MGNFICCPSDKDLVSNREEFGDSSAAPMGKCPVAHGSVIGAAPRLLDAPHLPVGKCPVAHGSGSQSPAVLVDHMYTIVLNKATSGESFGLDIDRNHLESRRVLTIVGEPKDFAKAWNEHAPENQRLREGDSILEVNGKRGKNAKELLDLYSQSNEVTLLLARSLSLENLSKDIEHLVKTKQCGPILVRLSWHDAGVFVKGQGCCPNAAMRFTDAGEGTWDANAGLPTVALQLLGPITRKYVPDLISHADLWTLAANIAIRVMGGPQITTRFGRTDAESSAKGCPANDGRLPDATQGANHLRAIFEPKGFNARDIVALSGAHTIGKCHMERSGFDGPWTEDHLRFDNTYFTELLQKEYVEETTPAGKMQFRHKASNCMMLPSDLALLKDSSFKRCVEEYAKDQGRFFSDFTAAWVKLQENGVEDLLRDEL